MNAVTIYQGDTWKPAIAVKSVDATTLVESAFNCTGYTAYLLIKTGFNETLAAVNKITVTWSAQSTGAGYFNCTNAISKLLENKRYAYEVKLQKDDASEVYTLDQGYLTVAPALEKDLPL